MKVTVLHHQSLLDIAIQHTGTVASAFDLALANGLSLTDDLEVGSWLMANSQELNANKDILNYYQSRQIKPATAISQWQISNQPEGIGYWTIGFDFKVS